MPEQHGELFQEDVEDQLGILMKRIEKCRGNLASHKIREEEKIVEMTKELHMLAVLRDKVEPRQPELVETSGKAPGVVVDVSLAKG